MFNTEKPYLFNTEKTATVFIKAENTITTDCNSVLFINNGTSSAYVVLNSIPIKLEPKETLSFDNDPQFFETTIFDMVFFEAGGTNKLVMVKSFTKKREEENEEEDEI